MGALARAQHEVGILHGGMVHLGKVGHDAVQPWLEALPDGSNPERRYPLGMDHLTTLKRHPGSRSHPGWRHCWAVRMVASPVSTVQAKALPPETPVAMSHSSIAKICVCPVEGYLAVRERQQRRSLSSNSS